MLVAQVPVRDMELIFREQLSISVVIGVRCRGREGFSDLLGECLDVGTDCRNEDVVQVSRNVHLECLDEGIYIYTTGRFPLPTILI